MRQIFRQNSPTDTIWRLTYIDYEKAKKLVETLLRKNVIEREIPNHLDMLLILGRLALKDDKYELSRKYIEEVEQLVENNEIQLTHRQTGRYLLLKAITLNFDGKILESREVLQNALDKAISGEDIYTQIPILYNLGEIEKESYLNFEKAIEYFNRSAVLAKSIHHPLLARILMNEGSCCVLSGLEERAIILCDQAISTMKANRKFTEKAAFYYLGALLQWHLGKLALTKGYISDCKRCLASETDYYTHIDLKLLEGKIAYSEMCYDEALRLANQADELMIKHSIYAQTDELQMLYKVVKTALGDYGQASTHRDILYSFTSKNKIHSRSKRF